ncbi:hypothetical protein JHK84_040148 [Glycine max]|nr:hypothetical protein JHK84_040148 [Glycine max]
MIQLHRTFFSTTTSSVPSSYPLSLGHFMLQFRALQAPPIALAPHATSSLIGATVQCRTRLLFPRRVTAKCHATSFSNFRFPFALNSTTSFGGSVFSRGFATRAAENGKQKKRARAAVVRGKEKDEGVINDAAPKEFDNVTASEGSLGEKKKNKKGSSPVAASGKEDEKSVKKKTAKKKTTTTLRSKKVAASSTQEDGAAEASKKSYKGKKKKDSKKSLTESAIEEMPENSASAKDELKKKNGNSSVIEEVKPPWNFTYKPLYPPTRKSVVVVESVTKAKVIKRYLGDMYEVLPSYGHVRDLAARSGSVRPDDDFSMVWEVPPPAWTHLKSIKVALSRAENLILASDPDREGEAIAWHIIEMLQQQGALHDNISLARVVFHEITEKSIKGALQTPREIDVNLVQAYLARRALDYLIGFNISPLLWRKLPGCQSAGRVQSAALSLICDREMEIDEFKPKEYWTVEVQMKKKELRSNKNLTFPAHLTHFDSKKLNKFSITSDTEARDIRSNINSADFHVVSLKKNKSRRNPPTPYITSTLQQDAANKLHFTASHTMKLAQKLYEGVELSDSVAVGLITYIRTDGLHISDEAVASIRSLIIERYGQDFVSQSAPKYYKKVKNAQEAHEAIRPTDIRKLPSMLSAILDEESLKLYTLIWSRTVSCQMEPAVFEQIQLDIGNLDESIILQSSISRVEFPGYRAVFTDIVSEAVQDKGSDESSHDQTFGVLNSLKLLALHEVNVAYVVRPSCHNLFPSQGSLSSLVVSSFSQHSIVSDTGCATGAIPIRAPKADTLVWLSMRSFLTGDSLHVVQTEPNQHHTQPPPRYSEASLVKKLEELGIGRPSTYASTIKVLQDRNYVTVKSRVLSPEFRGRMLDNVSAGLTEWKGLLRDYWTRFKSYCERTSNVHIHQVEKMLEKKFGDYLFASLPDQSRVCPRIYNLKEANNTKPGGGAHKDARNRAKLLGWSRTREVTLSLELQSERRPHALESCLTQKLFGAAKKARGAMS